jgi:predicted nucleic acid-binding protein
LDAGFVRVVTGSADPVGDWDRSGVLRGAGNLLAAGTHAPLRSNDAIHLATALRIGADEIVTYHGELPRSAASAGIRVVAPA